MARKKKSQNKPRRSVRAASVCLFCEEGIVPSYKNVELLSQFVTDRGKIVARARSGVCTKHQRRLAREIKRARHLALR